MARYVESVLEDDIENDSKWKIVLTCAWLVVPGVQYFGTVQRTDLQLTGTAFAPVAAALDLTPLYVLLVGLTVLCAAYEKFTSQSKLATVFEASSSGGEQS